MICPKAILNQITSVTAFSKVSKLSKLLYKVVNCGALKYNLNLGSQVGHDKHTVTKNDTG